MCFCAKAKEKRNVERKKAEEVTLTQVLVRQGLVGCSMESGGAHQSNPQKKERKKRKKREEERKPG